MGTTERGPSGLPSLQARRRLLVQDEIERAALRLLLARGYDAVSIDDIAAVVGMSGRTFFRYYATKDEILRRFQAGLHEALIETFKDRPADESALEALRARRLNREGRRVGRPCRRGHGSRTCRHRPGRPRTPNGWGT